MADPTVALEAVGKVGETIGITGAGFTPTYNVKITLGGKEVTTDPPTLTATDPDGKLPPDAKFTVPAVPAGSQDLKISDNATPQKTITLPFTVQDDKWARQYPIVAAVATLAAFFLLILLGGLAILNTNPIVVAIAFGMVGGIAHEIAQSGGKILIPTRDADGDLSLGTFAGMALGLVSGILILHTVDLSNLSTMTANGMTSIAFEALTAGLALKGIADVDAPSKPSAPSH